MLLVGMPIRKALVALLFLAALYCFLPVAGASPDDGNRPAGALVASSESRLSADTELTPLGLAALVAAGWVPALLLLTRRRRQQRFGADD